MIPGLTKKGNSITLNNAALVAWARTQNARGHHYNFNRFVNAVKAGEFKSAKYTGRGFTLGEHVYPDEFAKVVKGGITISNKNLFFGELVNHLRNVGACEPAYYAEQAFEDFGVEPGKMPVFKNFRVPVTIQVVEKGYFEIEATSQEDARRQVNAHLKGEELAEYVAGSDGNAWDFRPGNSDDCFYNESVKMTNAFLTPAKPKKGKKGKTVKGKKATTKGRKGLRAV